MSIPDAPTIPIAALTVMDPESEPRVPVPLVAKRRRSGWVLGSVLGVCALAVIVGWRVLVTHTSPPAEVDRAVTAPPSPAGLVPTPEPTASAGPSVSPSIVPALESEKKSKADGRHARITSKAATPPPPSAKTAPAPPPAPTENPLHL